MAVKKRVRAGRAWAGDGGLNPRPADRFCPPVTVLPPVCPRRTMPRHRFRERGLHPILEILHQPPRGRVKGGELQCIKEPF